jgi:CarboxypepD_reg-like domain
MKKFLRYAIFFIVCTPTVAKAQFETFKDSVVQLYGVVMTADSLKGVPAASVVIKGQNRGTISNSDGVFSIVALKGDQIEFSSIGYKPITITIPKELVGNQQSIIQLMVTDTVYLPATIIKARPTREQFERDFINNHVPDDQYAVAQKNNSAANRRFLAATLTSDGREASNQYLKQYSQKLGYSGQIAPQNIFNPFAWNEFIKAWKRGDYKRKR